MVVLVASALASEPAPLPAGLAPVLTWQPAWLVQPADADLKPRFSAWGRTPEGGFLVVADGDAHEFDALGGLDRTAYAGVRPYLWANETLVAEADHFWYCDSRLGLAEAATDGGLTHPRPWSTPPDGSCALYRDPAGAFVAVAATAPVAWRVAADGSQGRPFGVVDRATDAPSTNSIRPCGTTGDGVPLAARLVDKGRRLELVALADELRATTPVWSLELRASPARAWLTAAALDGADHCAFADGRAVFGGDRALVVFAGTELVSVMPPGVEHVDFVTPIDGGRGLAVVDGRAGAVRFFSEREPSGDAASLAAAGRWLAALRAWARLPQGGDVHLARARAMLAAGWWEEVVDAARTAPADAPPEVRAGLDGLATEARARMLLRWASREGDGPGWAGLLGARHPEDPRAFARTYVAELQRATARDPVPPVAWLALARVARRAGDRAVLLAALNRLDGVLDRLGDTPPEMFELYEAQGDTRRMAPLAGDDVVRRARLMRVAGEDPRGALALLGAASSPAADLLRARLLGDLGDLDGAITVWTRLVNGAGAGDAEVHAGLGVAYLRRGLLELSVAALLRARDLEPGRATHVSNLAAAYAALDRRNDALQTLYGAPPDPAIAHQLAALTTAAAPASAGGSLAVLPFDTAGGGVVPRVGLGDMVATMLLTELAPRTSVVERARLDAVFAEQQLQASRHLDPATAVRVGKLLGARQIVLGNVAEFEGRLVVDARRVDVATGEVLQSRGFAAPIDVGALRVELATMAGGLLSR